MIWMGRAIEVFYILFESSFKHSKETFDKAFLVCELFLSLWYL
jgi:hypothetical protein